MIEEIKSHHRKVRAIVDLRLREFESFRNKPSREWFSELCFCLLTANSRADTAISIQAELGGAGFSSLCQEDICACIRRHGHRFHNNKAAYIVEARKHLDIKSDIMRIAKSSQQEAREYLVSNIKGLGYKEASHFLRNVGYFDLAILDRHILRLMREHGLIGDYGALTPKKYIEIEKVFRSLAHELGMNAAELDLVMWHMKTGRILK